MIPKRIFWGRPGVIFGLTRPPCRPQSGMPIVVEEKEMASPLNVRYGINVGITFKRLMLHVTLETLRHERPKMLRCSNKACATASSSSSSSLVRRRLCRLHESVRRTWQHTSALARCDHGLCLHLAPFGEDGIHPHADTYLLAGA